jgi:serine/threonine protein kinase
LPRYDDNVESICQELDFRISKETVYDIGKAILNNLEAVHEAGYVYNDLKLDNLMVGYQ